MFKPRHWAIAALFLAVAPVGCAIPVAQAPVAPTPVGLEEPLATGPAYELQARQSKQSKPTGKPTPKPSQSASPTPAPTPVPTATPTPVPSATPTPAPSATPTPAPSATPTPAPSATPTPAPTPSPSATPTPSPSASTGTSIYQPVLTDVQKAMVNQVLTLTNQHRATAGAKALVLDTALTGVATYRSSDMATRNYFSHTDPDGHGPFWHLNQAGISYNAAAENIAYGYSTPEAVVTGWMNSTGHRTNILNPNLGKLGVGYVKNSNGTPYWTQLFTN